VLELVPSHQGIRSLGDGGEESESPSLVEGVREILEQGVGEVSDAGVDTKEFWILFMLTIGHATNRATTESLVGFFAVGSLDVGIKVLVALSEGDGLGAGVGGVDECFHGWSS
jgi:hypothetical protein